MSINLPANQRDDLVDELIDIELCSFERSFLGEPAGAGNHVARAPRAADHLFDRASRLIESRRLKVEPSQARVAIGDDASERLVDFVRDRGRQLPQGRQPRGVGELSLRDPQRLFGALAFGDVERDPTKLVRAPRDRLKEADLRPGYAATLAPVAL